MSAETYKPFPKQQEFHRNPAKYRLFGGAAGPGKTKALLWEGITQAVENQGASVLLLRRTFPELEMSFLKEWSEIPVREWGITWNDSKHVAKFSNGSTLRFGYCRLEKDVYQYQGAEFLFIGLDELTMFTLRQWQFLTSRNRCPIPGTFPCMAGATNPGNVGHAWVKSLWIDKQAPSGYERPELYNPDEYAFIPALIRDNPIYANDASYRQTLETLPAHLRKAFLEGDWNVFAGQYFDIFDQAEMVEREESWDLQPWHTRWLSIDWGFEHPACCHWHALPEDNRTRTYREFQQNHLSPRMLAQGIIERTRDEERITSIYLSPDAFAKRTSEASIAEQMGDAFTQKGWPRPIAADDDRVGGWMLMYQMLDAGQWIIGSGCRELIKGLPLLVRDPLKIEDVQKMEGDDAADCARYGLKSRHSVARRPLEVRVSDRISDMRKVIAPERITDPTAVAMMAQKALELERKKDKPAPLFRSQWRRRFRP
jgi:phage terminase large subunit